MRRAFFNNCESGRRSEFALYARSVCLRTFRVLICVIKVLGRLCPFECNITLVMTHAGFIYFCMSHVDLSYLFFGSVHTVQIVSGRMPESPPLTTGRPHVVPSASWECWQNSTDHSLRNGQGRCSASSFSTV